jgi:hypothetical protein
MLSRRAWIEACEFHPGTNRNVRDRVLARVRSQSQPVILLDLDHTLYRNALRTRAVLRALLPELKSRLPLPAATLLEGLEEARMGFSLRDTFRLNGLFPEDPQWTDPLALLRKEWWPRFFSNEFMEHDVPYPGAVEFCRELAEAGARLIYLSARSGPVMREGTHANLKRDGFPLRAFEDVWLKDDEVGDGAHKIRAVARCVPLGTVVASFENEPANTASLFAELPGAMHVFLDTVCSEVPAVPVRGLWRLTSYL